MGDIIDAKDLEMGCWFEAALIKITKRQANTTQSAKMENKNTATDQNDNVTKDTNDNVTRESEKKDLVGSQSSQAESAKTDTGSETESTSTTHLSPFPEGHVEDDGYLYHVMFEG